MSLDVRCARCFSGLDDPGGLLFGPPDVDEQVTKAHFCLTCFADVSEWIAATAGGGDDA